MKKIFSKRFLVLLISVATVGGGIAAACADGWMEFENSNFTQEAFV